MFCPAAFLTPPISPSPQLLHTASSGSDRIPDLAPSPQGVKPPIRERSRTSARQGNSSGPSPPLPAAELRLQVFLPRLHGPGGYIRILSLISHPGGLCRSGGRGRRRIETSDLRVSEPWQGKVWFRLGLKSAQTRVFVSRLPLL